MLGLDTREMKNDGLGDRRDGGTMMIRWIIYQNFKTIVVIVFAVVWSRFLPRSLAHTFRPFQSFRQCRWSIVPVNDAISPGIDIISSEIGAITIASRPFPVVIAIFLVPTIFFAQLPPKERDFRPQTPPHPPT